MFQLSHRRINYWKACLTFAPCVELLFIVLPDYIFCAVFEGFVLTDFRVQVYDIPVKFSPYQFIYPFNYALIFLYKITVILFIAF
jgi:hypothetical protein